jgi:prephenate dehydrogenase
MKLGIAGAGAMGSWFASLARSEGWEVYLFDPIRGRAERVARRTGARRVSTLEELGERAEVLLAAVPISRTPEVIRTLSRGKEELLMDLASVKGEVVRTMRGIRGPELASLHPLFGPGAKTLRGKTVISVPVRVGRRYREFLRFLSSRGARVVEMGAEEHDRMMAVTQALTHFLLLSCAGALEGLEPREELSTPLFSSLLQLVRASLASDPSLCGEIQLLNPHSRKARERLLEVMGELHGELSSGKTGRLCRILERGNRRWGREVREAYRRLYEELERSGSSP